MREKGSFSSLFRSFSTLFFQSSKYKVSGRLLSKTVLKKFIYYLFKGFFYFFVRKLNVVKVLRKSVAGLQVPTGQHLYFLINIAL